MKILMVCLGNICRSPLAEGIMKKKIQEHQLNWKVDSAGTAAWHAGEKPDSRSIKVAQKNNIDILNQRGRQFQARDLDDFDLVLTMDATNYQNVRYLTTSSEQENKIHLIMNFVNPGLNQQVPDPYITDGFESVFEMLELACNKIIEKYKWDIPR
ncbi:MAG: low molecular weight phosphotyrosine protein phosphatase [Saprospiraceae bacterium]|jgi:protein-tyrosine phosphatase|nr:low molecular weight phosphotyrosine protein phosphatase [Saprospiraceae bacterium]